MSERVLTAIRNGAVEAPGVRFPGLAAPPLGFAAVLEARAACHFRLAPGDLLLIDTAGAGFHPVVAVFDDEGRAAPEALGLSGTRPLSACFYDAARLTAWRAAQGGAPGPVAVTALPRADGALVLAADAPCDAWFIAPVAAEALVTGGAAGEAMLSLQPRPHGLANGGALLPPPLGAVREEFTVPRGTARAYSVARGEIVQVLDVEGQQCSDFMAFRAAPLEAGLERMIDSTVTRSLVRRAYPGPGLFDRFYDSEMRPLLAVVQDTVGRHDTFALACTARGYEDKGFPGHLNCSDNISDAMAPYGVAARPAWPAINFFFNSWIDRADNLLSADEAWSRPGDYVAMRALDDLVCVSTACPDDIDPINGWNPTDVHVRIYRADAPIRRAVAYRQEEGAVPAISQESPFHPRTSALTRQFAPARDLWLPTAYAPGGETAEYWACREAVTLQDLSSLRKYDIKGPDAERLLQQATTRDIARLAVHRGTYTLLCDDTGAVIDDGTLFRLAPQLFRWCCGAEESARTLQALAQARGLRVRIEALAGALPNLALQGPKSRAVLERLVHTGVHMPALAELRWFGCTVGRIGDREGAPFLLTRTGFTGELGYELFCDRADALGLWDALMEAGAPFGIRPMGGAALETL
ncbi:MAG: DUF1989 domain-containing protein, partial [Pseudomonadota bacterium]